MPAEKFEDEFQPGEVYNRRSDIHGRYKGQQQGGMSSPAQYPYIFLFTGAAGDDYGYSDVYAADGTFHYTGEGMRGDMEFVRNNKALRDHLEHQKHVHLFESTTKRGFVRYVGEVRYLDHYRRELPDFDGELRSAIVFELELLPPDSSADRESDRSDREMSRELKKLRELSLTIAPANAKRRVKKQNVIARSEAVKRYVLTRAGGFCEGCEKPGPFMSKSGEPYLEPHHTTRLADGGPDHPDHVIALCPACHRRVHYGVDGEDYSLRLKKLLSVLTSCEPDN